MLKITGGRYKGSNIIIPKGDHFRPTLAKSRESLFNIVCNRYDIQKYVAQDLFAGSGILGFEAISRGAHYSLFIENSLQSVTSIRKNIQKLSLEKQCEIHFGDSIQWMKSTPWQSGKYLFFVDPPYQTQLAQETLNLLSENATNINNSLLVIETHKKQTLNIPQNLNCFQQKTYGLTHLDFFEIITPDIK